MVLLGVNIDHVATLRNARGGNEPDPIQAAFIAEENGADGITAHLREDRRHIRDADIHQLKARIKTRLNLEMAATDEMVRIALEVNPHMVTLVPERREEVTTEGGLDVVRLAADLTPKIADLVNAGILVSLFIAPEPRQIEASKTVGAQIIELHTGEYAHGFQKGPAEATYALKQLIEGSKYAHDLGLEINAGHGLTTENVGPIVDVPHMVELNIGHHIISRAVFIGLAAAVREMKALLTTP